MPPPPTQKKKNHIDTLEFCSACNNGGGGISGSLSKLGCALPDINGNIKCDFSNFILKTQLFTTISFEYAVPNQEPGKLVSHNDLPLRHKETTKIFFLLININLICVPLPFLAFHPHQRVRTFSKKINMEFFSFLACTKTWLVSVERVLIDI